MHTSDGTIQLQPIGTVVNNHDGDIHIRIAEPYRPGLKDLDLFSHVMVFWWAARYDSPETRQTLVVPLPYAEGHEAGVFACRAPVRPNLIMTTVCKIKSVDEPEGIVRITNIDAFNETPIIDLKPYYGCTDRVRDPRTPEHTTGWPEWLPEEGIGLMPHETSD